MPVEGRAVSNSRVEYIQLPSASVGPLGEVLPIPRPRYQPMTEIDYRKVKPPPRFEVKPPEGAPNVVIVLMDQLWYADPAAFGGPIRMPTLDRLAKEGLTYTNFHVNALCSPSRMSLLTGRNSHSAASARSSMRARAIPAIRACGRTAARRSARSCGTGATYRVLRQVPRSATLRGERQRAVRPLAGAERLRQVLRLPRGRAVAAAPEPDRRDDPHRHAARSRLPLQHGHDRSGDRLGAGNAFADAGSALPHVLLAERRPSAAHAAEGLARAGSVQGRVR